MAKITLKSVCDDLFCLHWLDQFLVAEITFKVAYITSSMTNIPFVVTEVMLRVAVITSAVYKISLFVAKISFVVAKILLKWL